MDPHERLAAAFGVAVFDVLIILAAATVLAFLVQPRPSRAGRFMSVVIVLVTFAAAILTIAVTHQLVFK